MSTSQRDAAHLLRVIGLLLGGVVVFAGVRALLVPEGFGTLGHYRPGALDDNREGTLVHAGRAACAECHDDAAALLARGRHAAIGCESCHGPQGAHARAPEDGAPARPDPALLCVSCHLANVGRPAAFPQIVPADHAGEAVCVECHTPHQPAQAPGEKP